MADDIVDRAAIHFRPDFRGFQEEYRKKLNNMTPKKIGVGLSLETRGFQEAYRAYLRKLTPKTVKVRVELVGDRAVLTSLRQLNRASEDLGRQSAVRRSRIARSEAEEMQRVHNLALRMNQAFDEKRKRLDEAEAARKNKLRRDDRRAAEREWQEELREARHVAVEQSRIFERAQRDVERSQAGLRKSLSQGLGRGTKFGGGIIDFGGRGVRPMHALYAAAATLVPALFSLGTSAGLASTSLLALGPAALGAVTSVGALTFAFAGVTDAFKNYVQAQDGNEAAAQRFNQQMQRMSPAAQELTNQLIALKESSRGFGYVMQQETLPGISRFLELLRSGGRNGVSLIDIFKTSAANQGRLFNRGAATAGRLFSTDKFKDQTATSLGNYERLLDSLLKSAINLAPALVRVAAAASTLLPRFGRFVETMTVRFLNFLDRQSDQKLILFFQRAGDEMALWGRIAGNLLRFLGALFQINDRNRIGTGLAENIERITDSLADWAESGAGQNSIRNFFKFFAELDYAKIAAGIGKVLVAIVAFRALAGVATIVDGFAGAYNRMTDAFDRRRKFEAAAAGGTFVDVDLDRSKRRGLAPPPLIGGRVPIGGLATGGGLAARGIGAGAAGGAAGGAGAAAAGGPITAGIVAALAVLLAMAGAFYILYKNSKQFRDIISQIGTAFKRMYDAFMAPVMKAIRGGIDKITGSLGKKGGILDSVEKILPVLEKIGVAFASAFGEAVAKVIETVTGAVSGLLDKLTEVQNALGVIGNAAGVGEKKPGIVSQLSELLPFLGPGLGLTPAEAPARHWDPFAKPVPSQWPGTPSFLKDRIVGRGVRPAGGGGFAITDPDAGGGLLKLMRPPTPILPDLDKAVREAKGNVTQIRTTLKSAADAYVDASRAARDAVWALDDAEKARADTLRDRIQAERDLIQARKDAAENIRQLRLQVQGLAADEAAAQLRVDVAKEAVKSFEFSNSADPLFKRGLRNDVALAEQELREQRDKGRTTRTALREAERRGVEGADNVRAARERLIEIGEDLVQRERDITQAQEDVARTSEQARQKASELATQRGLLTKAIDSERLAIDRTRVAYGQLAEEQKKIKAKITTQVDVKPLISGRDPKDVQKFGLISVIGAKSTAPISTTDVQRKKRAAGGLIRGPGGPRGDKIPSMLSDYEYVQTADATLHYGVRAMDNIKNKRIPRAVLEQYGHDTPRRYADGGFVWPLPGYHRIHPLGTYGYPRGSYTHGGVDFPAPAGSPILAALAGTVIQSGRYGGGGNTVSLAHAGNLVTRYMHMSRILAGLGQAVKAGQRIGLVGTTGDSTGNHLHFQAERPPGSRFNPMSLIGGAPDTTGFIGPYQPGAVAAKQAPTISKNALLAGAGAIAAQFADRNAVRLANSLGAGVAMPKLARYIGIPELDRDQGGPIPAGVSVVNNRTGKPETVRNARQEQALADRPIRLDRRDLRLLAALVLEGAAARPIEMDGQKVAAGIAARTYVPTGV